MKSEERKREREREKGIERERERESGGRKIMRERERDKEKVSVVKHDNNNQVTKNAAWDADILYTTSFYDNTTITLPTAVASSTTGILSSWLLKHELLAELLQIQARNTLLNVCHANCCHVACCHVIVRTIQSLYLHSEQ